ncbi:MAG TPA: L,D-transpeptidase family protein [Gaiellaceae bacterium]|nr:L,D-transpeptidase family protein [Gaiellaceae bacterium]
MRRGLLLACLLIACGLSAAAARADNPGGPTLLVPDGVTIDGVDVGGYAPADAQQAVASHFDESRRILVGTRPTLVPPRALGASAAVGTAVQQALLAGAGTDVPLKISVNRARTAAWVRQAAKLYDRSGTDSTVKLRNGKPFITAGTRGHSIDQRRAVTVLAKALAAKAPGAIKLPVTTQAPSVSRSNFGPVIVIHRGAHRLNLYRGMRPWQTFGVAVGQPAYPTPLGRFAIVVMWRNPWWFPPNSPWAQGESPVPPGPGNPLGTRWMGLSAPGVGIHGTPDPASIGYSASHGCIRMLIPQAEWLFRHVRVGTPVFITPN